MDEQPEPVVLGIKSVMMEWNPNDGELTGHGAVVLNDGFTLLFITAYRPTEGQIRSALKRCQLVAVNAMRDGTTNFGAPLVMEW